MVREVSHKLVRLERLLLSNACGDTAPHSTLMPRSLTSATLANHQNTDDLIAATAALLRCAPSLRTLSLNFASMDAQQARRLFEVLAASNTTLESITLSLRTNGVREALSAFPQLAAWRSIYAHTEGAWFRMTRKK